MYYNNYPTSYHSKKIPNKVSICRSPIEFKYFRELDNDPEVLQYIPEPFKIPYNYDNKILNYIPDVLIEYANGTKKLVEIKALKEVSKPINIAKFNAAKDYANKNGMIFQIIVRYVQGSHVNLPVEGEYDDHVSAMKSEDRWVYKRILPPLIIFVILLILILVFSGIKNAIHFIFIIILMLFCFFRVFYGR